MWIKKVKLGKRSYDIVVGRNIISSLGACIKKLDIGDHAYIITNSLVKMKYASSITCALKKSGFSSTIREIPDTERSKSIAILSAVINDLAKSDLRKRTFIIALGGGVVGDLSGFVASIYKRGVAYIQIPTTLLAQVDSAIGGKTAVDLKEGKNLIGAFYQPALVFSDVSLLKSLGIRQLRSGLAEAIKYGVIKDKSLFTYLEKWFKDILKHREAALEYIVKRSSVIKADIVSRDEKEEKGLRTILNFGHTIGHAIEAATGFKKYTHGEAVALGMLIAVEISQRLKYTSQGLATRVEALINAAGLPTKISGTSLRSIINASFRDKKFIGSRNRFVLTTGLGKTKIVENIPLRIIEEVLKERIG